LTTQIFIGLLAGVAIGHFWPDLGMALRPLADAFLRLIKMIVGPLVLSTLVVGIAGTGDLKAMGRIGFKALVYFEVATTLALFIGLTLVNLFRPGAGLAVPVVADAADVTRLATGQQTVWETFLHLFPTSVFDALARGDVLQVVVFSSFFGLALAAIGTRGEPVLAFFESVAQVMFVFTGYVMRFAPLGVMAAIAATVGRQGLSILVALAKLILVMYGGLVIFVCVVVVGVALLIRVPFLTFARAIRDPFIIAFSTASSEAALPKALEVMERFGCPKRIVGFVLPTGYSFNLDGSTLYLSVASVFVAQLAGVDLTLGQQLIMMLTLMVTSKGVAGVPRGALVVLMATLNSFSGWGIPLEGAAILLGVDQVLDMGRTAVNVMGNCIAAAVVARWEGVFDDAKMRAFASGSVAGVAAEGVEA